MIQFVGEKIECDMKKLILISVVFILLLWVLYFGIQIIVGKSLGHDIDLVEKGIIATLFSLFLSINLAITGIPSIFPRLKYLESNDTVKPPFKIAYSSVIDVPKGFDFGHLRTEYNETNI